jgi:hypothetical protein
MVLSECRCLTAAIVTLKQDIAILVVFSQRKFPEKITIVFMPEDDHAHAISLIYLPQQNEDNANQK